MCFTVELSRKKRQFCCAEQAYLLSSEVPRQVNKASGVDALRGNTRSHPEHDGQDLSGRWYCIGDDVGEQVGAGSKKKTSEELVHIETDTGK